MEGFEGVHRKGKMLAVLAQAEMGLPSESPTLYVTPK